MIEIDDQLRRRRAAAGLVCVLIAVLGVWLRSLSGEFVSDDKLSILRNPELTQLSNWPSVVGHPSGASLDAQTGQHQGGWHPLAGTLLLFTNVLGHNSPLWFHWVAVLLHIAATAAAFALALELTGASAVALLAALLFGVHPAHTQSVAWISALDDSLCACFVFLALRGWIRWRKAGSAGPPWTAGLLLLFALLSKEAALAVVPLALFYDLASTRKASPARAWLPFALAGLIWYAGRVAVFGELAAGFGHTATHFGVGAVRLAQLRIELFGGYTWLSLWPLDVQLLHPFHPTLSGSDPEFLRALACSAGLIAAIAWAWRRRATTLAFALAFLPLSVLPGLVRVGSLGTSPLSERELSFGLFGIVLALVWCVWRWLPRALALVCCLVIGTLYSLRSVERTAFWHDDLVLLRSQHAQTPQLPEPCWNLGRVLLESYRESGSFEDLAEATRVFWKGLDLIDRAQKGDGSIFATRNDHVQINLGVAWCLLYDGENSGDLDNGADKIFQQVVQRYPESDQALVGLASSQVQRGQLDEAENSLRAAIAKNERNVEAHKNLGIVLMSRGNLDGAQAELVRALELRPDHLEDLIWLARITLQQGKEEDARRWIDRARAAHPDSSAPLVVEALLATRHDQFDTALQLVDRALERNHDDGEALALKGKLHLRRGEKNSAQQALVRACELLPASFEVNYNMGALLLEHSTEEALPYLVRAYELRPPGKAADALREQLLRVPFSAARTPCELAQADLARGDLAAASEWAIKAQAIEPGNGDVHLVLGDIAQRRGAQEDAVRELEAARRLLPSSLEARYALAKLYIQATEKQKAIDALQELLKIFNRQGSTTPKDEALRRSAREMLEDLRNGAIPK